MVSFLVYLVLSIITYLCADLGILMTWIGIVLFVLFDFQIFILNFVLSRPLIGRFREYSFQKYHNTYDHNGLF